MTKSGKNLVDRRKFLKGAAVGSIATLVGSTGAIAAQQAPAGVAAKLSTAVPNEEDPVGAVEVLTTDRPGSDFMVDVIKSLGFEYVAAVCGSSFRSLHESIINYGGNKAPELITCCHEESSVNIAHGYTEIEGKPMLVLVHATVGLQHASMAVYDAWVGRTPVCIMIGNALEFSVGAHASADVAAMVRDFSKWDDNPISLPHFAESTVRAYKYAMTLPRGPVLISVDSQLQETPIAKDAALHIPKLALDTAPQADSGSIAEVARLLVAAENPVIMAGRVARSQAGMDHFIEFVETLQAPVLDQGGNLPSHHPLNQEGGRALIQDADLILGLESEGLYGATHTGRDQLVRTSRQISKPGAKVISITTADLYARSNFAALPRYAEVDLAIAADPEVTLPALTEAIKRLLTDDRKRAFQDRGKRFADASQKARERARIEAADGWDSSPISLHRISAEVWDQVKNEDWATANRGDIDVGLLGFQWKCDKYYQRTNSVSAGIGFRLPAAVGAALAHKKYGRLFVYQQNDGDLMFVPGSLWTAAHHQIPMLAIMHNNRAYHEEVMHVERMAARHNRGIDRAGIGTKLENPNLDFAKIAQGMGLYAEGPISNPNDLGPAIKRALAVVKKGEPALLDVVTQPR